MLSKTFLKYLHVIKYSSKTIKKFTGDPMAGIITKYCILNSSISICIKHVINYPFVKFLEEI